MLTKVRGWHTLRMVTVRMALGYEWHYQEWLDKVGRVPRRGSPAADRQRRRKKGFREVTGCV